MELLQAFQSLPEGKKNQLASQYGLKLHAISNEEFEAQLQRNIPEGLKKEMINLVKVEEKQEAPTTHKLTKKVAVAFLKANKLDYDQKATVDELNALVEGAIKERTEAKESYIGVDGVEVTFEEKPEPTEPVVGVSGTDEVPKSKSQSRRKAASAGKKK